ncbi:MAG: nuclear transport factor 2 family protein, partial [Gammaproteobacteria bacterium]|nr:nuclear transport factor 2 family protein [Gammaproteobacteria bacterium]
KTIALCLSLGALTHPGLILAAGDHAHDEDLSKGEISSYRELTPTEATIQAVLDTYGQAMEQGSVEIMEQAVIPGDFSTIESGYPNWSWEDFRDNHFAVEVQQFSDVDYDMGLILGEFQGDLGFAIFRYTASGKVGNNPVSISGLGTAILELDDGQWKMHHLHTSAPRNQLQQAEEKLGGHGGDSEGAAHSDHDGDGHSEDDHGTHAH